MGEAIGGAILEGLVIFVIYFVLYLIVSRIRRARFKQNRPEGPKRQQLLSDIRKMRQDGADYRQRLAYLREMGLRRDVADELLGEAEQPSAGLTD